MDATPATMISEDERRKIVIGVLLVMLLAALDQTIVAPAVPVIGASLGDVAYLPWIVSAYFLTATATTPLYGKLADLKGRRPVLFTAIGIFVAGSVISALAPTMLALVLGRAIQGLGGGGLMALAQIVIGDVVPPRERGRYMVYISVLWGTASVGGPIVGGFFAQHLHWSLIFWINVPLAGIAVVMTNRILQRLPDVRHDHRLDYWGAVLVMTASIALMLLLTWAGTRYAWVSPEVLGLSLLVVVLVSLFGVHLRRVVSPLIPLSILAHPVILFATISVFFAMGVNVGMSVYVPLYLEMVHGMQAAQSGMALVGFLGASVFGANFAGRAMMSMTHYKRLAVGGTLLAVAGSVVLALGAGSFDFITVEGLLCLIGTGLGTQFPVMTVSVQNAAPPNELGVATSLLAFLRSLGSAIGVSVLGAILLGTGIIHTLGDVGARSARTVDPLAQAAAGHAFGLLFGACAVSLVLSLVCLLVMEERPLRGRAPAAADP